jgi:hypothetical protein
MNNFVSTTNNVNEMKEVSPNKLPFLQAQVLQQIFIDFHENKQTTLEKLSELTDYPKDSKS